MNLKKLPKITCCVLFFHIQKKITTQCTTLNLLGTNLLNLLDRSTFCITIGPLESRLARFDPRLAYKILLNHYNSPAQSNILMNNDRVRYPLIIYIIYWNNLLGENVNAPLQQEWGRSGMKNNIIITLYSILSLLKMFTLKVNHFSSC